MSKHHKTKPLHSFVHRASHLCQFCSIWAYNVRIMDFLKSDNWIKLFLCDKNHKFHAACPNAMKQSFWPPTCIMFSIPANFTVFGPIVWKLCFFRLKNWIKLKKHKFYTTCPKATKPSPCTLLCIKLCICTKNVPLTQRCEIYWISKF